MNVIHLMTLFSTKFLSSNQRHAPYDDLFSEISHLK